MPLLMEKELKDIIVYLQGRVQELESKKFFLNENDAANTSTVHTIIMSL